MTRPARLLAPHTPQPTHPSTTDVFTTFKDLLTRHKPLVAHFLAENYTEVGGGGGWVRGGVQKCWLCGCMRAWA